MNHLVLFMLLGWLGCTIVMTVNAVRSGRLEDRV